jgi:hypothetical protein
MDERMQAGLEFVFQVRVDFAGRLKLPPERNGVGRGYTGVAGGIVEGPLYVLQASDGTHIVINNRGLRHAPPDVLAKMNAFEPVDPASYYFRINPTFDVPAGPHDWLGRTIIVGGADRHRTHSIFSYYALV